MLLAVPAAHPILLPLVGVPSHLLWFVHVLGVATVTYRWGRYAAAWYIPLSAVWVLAGERIFGAGYGVPAEWRTALSLTASVLLLDLLMFGFAGAARRVTHRYQILFEALNVGIVLIGARHRIEAANPEACRILDTSGTGLVGRHVDTVLPAPIPGVEELETGPRWEGNEALAGVAHEFKNPLQGISGYAELGLVAGRTTEQMRKYFDRIIQQTRRLNQMMQDLLGFSRSGSAGIGEVELDEAINEVVSMHRIARGRRVAFDVESVPGFIATGDPDRIQQILLNLIGNASDAIEAGGGRGALRTSAALPAAGVRGRLSSPPGGGGRRGNAGWGPDERPRSARSGRRLESLVRIAALLTPGRASCSVGAGCRY